MKGGCGVKFLCAMLSVLMLCMCAFGACAETEAVTFADAVIEKAIRKTLNAADDTPLTTDDLAKVLEFDCDADGVETLQDLAYCVNLESFILRGETPAAFSLTPFGGLTKLTFFRIDGNVINTAPVAALPQLKTLQIGGCVSELDLSPLEGRDNLESFYLKKRAQETETDLSPLQSHVNLRQATLPELNEGELRPLLESWPKLRYLNVSAGSVTTDDLAALATRELNVLQLSTNGEMIRDFSPLAAQTELYRVDVTHIDNEGLTSLAESVPGLRKLFVNTEDITDFTPLLSLTQLEMVQSYGGHLLTLLETLKDTAVEINPTTF